MNVHNRSYVIGAQVDIPAPGADGTIRRVVVDVSGAPYVDLERQAAAMLARE